MNQKEYVFSKETKKKHYGFLMLSFIPSFDQNAGQKNDVVNISYRHKFRLYP